MTVYPVAERPSVEVQIGGVWLPGQLRMIHDDGRCNVSYTRDSYTYLDNVPAARVREVP